MAKRPQDDVLLTHEAAPHGRTVHDQREQAEMTGKRGFGGMKDRCRRNTEGGTPSPIEVSQPSPVQVEEPVPVRVASCREPEAARRIRLRTRKFYPEPTAAASKLPFTAAHSSVQAASPSTYDRNTATCFDYAY
jgi:hypothetical protein